MPTLEIKPNMSAVEARAEIKRLAQHVKGIEDNYPNGLTEDVNAEDCREVKESLGLIDQYEAKLSGLEDVERRRIRTQGLLDRYNKPAERPAHLAQTYKEGKMMSPGRQFIEDREYARLRDTGAFNSPINDVKFMVEMRDGTSLIEWQRHASMEQKALLMSGSTSVTQGSAFVTPELRPGIVDLLQRELTFIDVVPRYETSSDVIEYVREDTFTNNAAFTAEASASTGTSGTKPESVLSYSVQTAPVLTLAHYIPVTNRLLADAPAIRGIIDGRLLLGLALILESQMLTGSGSGNFTGILNTSNVLTQGVTGTNNVLDAIFLARQQVRVTGHARPNVVVLHPNDFAGIRLLREGTATGTYLMGPPSQAGPMTVWGMPVIESEAITENTGLVADMVNGCGLWDREQAGIRVGTINDQFIRNIQTILAELRAAFTVLRPTAFCKVTGI